MSGDSNKPTVSILLANYNHAEFLHDSLGGIFGQTRKADEIIIVDDGSTDDSLEIITKYIKKDTNSKLLLNEKNKGVQYTISRALNACSSKFFVWTAADDILEPNFLERSMSMIESHPDTGLVFSQLATFDHNTKKTREMIGNKGNMIAFWIGDSPCYLNSKSLFDRLDPHYLWISGNTVVANRRMLCEAGGFLPQLEWHSDWFAYYVVALRYGVCGIPETLAKMRVVPNTYSSSGIRDQKRQRRVLREIANTLATDDFADIRRKIRARPSLISPLGMDMAKVLASNPRDWDIFIRYMSWIMNHRGRIQSQRLNSPVRSRRLKAKFLTACLFSGSRVMEKVAPRRWYQP